MAYPYPTGGGEGGPRFIKILAAALFTVVMIIVLSILLMALAPLDLYGMLRSYMPLIIAVIVAYVAGVALYIVLIYIPGLIRGE